MSDIKDMINSVLDKNPMEFSAAFDDVLRQRIVSAVEDHRQVIAQSIYGESLDEDDEDIEDEDSDLDLDDFDLDDLDFDFEDLEDGEEFDDES